MIDSRRLIGEKVLIVARKRRGIIKEITNGSVIVSFGVNSVCRFPYPAAFADALRLADSDLQASMNSEGENDDFDRQKQLHTVLLNNEIKYLKEHGGKKYRVIDGELISGRNSGNIYIFETDAELHLPDGTDIKFWWNEEVFSGEIVSCEDFSVTLKTGIDLGRKVEMLEFTADQWHLLASLVERVEKLEKERHPLAYEILCTGKSKVSTKGIIVTGQDKALARATSERITFIWGPPGTGKTTTLATIAAESLAKGKRVLMLSYSNVSVDGALLKVAQKCEDRTAGDAIRYGYPRSKELLDNPRLTSYGFVLSQYPELDRKYGELTKIRKSLSPKSAKRLSIDKEISEIRATLKDKERELVQKASFVATTVSKAVVDSAIYNQRFDVVIFDEASMAYIPQVAFAASLSKGSFCCLGDFKQLSAIVQNPMNEALKKDIFEHTGIIKAVECEMGHEWLVMLNTQYRMHPTIADFAGKTMYHDLLGSPDSLFSEKQAIANHAPFPSESAGMLDLSGMYSVCIKTMDHSRINLLSAMMSVYIAERYADSADNADSYEVGIITPYSAQSRLIISMIRDLQEKDSKYKRITCATVHQFQGSEKAIIIYDAVDCFRMPYPGVLLTNQKNDEADRLFNVALTRAQGKFILIVNHEYMLMKNLSKQLLFSKFMTMLKKEKLTIRGEELFDSLGSETVEEQADKITGVFLGDRDEEDSWNRFLADIENASHSIFFEIPGPIDDDYDAKKSLTAALKKAEEREIRIAIKTNDRKNIPQEWESYYYLDKYAIVPTAVIDNRIVWFGQPLCAANFVSSGTELETVCFPCLRHEGRYLARQMKAILNIPSMQEKQDEEKEKDYAGTTDSRRTKRTR